MFEIGQKATIEKVFSKEEVISYAKMSNDTNPVHYDEVYASKTFFGKPIVHGLLVASLFGGLMGSKLPGKGTIHLGQELKFTRPVYVGEKVTATIEITDLKPEKSIIIFQCTVIKEDNTTAITGSAVAMYKGEFFKK